MLLTPQRSQRNALLRCLPPSDYADLAPLMRPIQAEREHCLVPGGERQKFVYFPQSGLGSVTSHHAFVKVEVGMIGREGLIGVPVLLDAQSSSCSTIVQMPGIFLRISTAAFQAFVTAHPEAKAIFLRFVQAYLLQVSSTAVSNAAQTLEQRLARWLLMVHDRADGSDLVLTHEFIAIMLAVRRPGVTVATHVLEGGHAIKASRGRIRIVDRKKLEAFAGDTYGLAEAEYERLIGVPLRG